MDPNPTYVEPSLSVAYGSTDLDTLPTVSTEPVLEKPAKRKRLLSDKQREALQIERERR